MSLFKKRKNLSQEEKEDLARRDIVWKVLFLDAFVVILILFKLEEYKLNSPLIDGIVVTIGIFMFFYLPSRIFPKVQKFYDIFQNKRYLTAETKEERNRAKVIYNMIIFIPMVFIAYPVANAITLELFNKNHTINLILIVLLDALALWFSVWFTNRKSTPNDNKE